MGEKRQSSDGGAGWKGEQNGKRHKTGRAPGPGILVTAISPRKGPHAAREVADEINSMVQESTAAPVEKKMTVADSLQAEIEAMNEDAMAAPYKFYGDEPARGVVFVRRTAAKGICPSAAITKLREKEGHFRCAVRLTPIDFACAAHVPQFDKLVAEHLAEALKAFPGLKEWNILFHHRNMDTITKTQALDCLKKHMPEGMYLSVSDPDLIIAVEVNPLIAGFSIVEEAVAENEFKFGGNKSDFKF